MTALRFRRRLRLAFITVASLAAALLAAGTFFTVREYRERAFEERAVQEATVDLGLVLAASDAGRVSRLLELYELRPTASVVVVFADGKVRSSRPGVDLDDIPSALRPPADMAAPATATTTIEGDAHLVVGQHDQPSGVSAYVLFSRGELDDSLRELLIVLGAGWLVVTAIAGAAGATIARRTLAPVRAATVAAHTMAERLLDRPPRATSEDEFQALAGYLSQLADALAEKIDRLRAAYERERQLTADAAHELRTPLSGLVSAASVLVEDAEQLPEDARRATDLVVADARRLRVLVEELLELSRIDAARALVHPEPVYLAEAVAEAAATVNLSGLVVNGEAVVDTDRWRIQRILVNLLDNVARHGAPPATVDIAEADGHVTVTVADDGPGIPEADVQLVFERFYKSDHGRGRGSGSGLGLAIARENAGLLGAGLAASNREGGGAEFRLVLPEHAPHL